MSGVDLTGEVFDSMVQPSGLTWTVIEKVERPANFSGGNRSTSYKVRSSKGRIAFLKAVDAELFDLSHGILVSLTACSLQHTNELKVLQHCSDRSMSKVMVPIDHIERVDVFNGTKQPVFGLIFDLAERDARQAINESLDLDLRWAVDVMHSVCVGISQLHGGRVVHNDLKPSNILHFGQTGHKVGDLGSATCATVGIFSIESAGDPRYAPPELLYQATLDTDTFTAGRAAELYLLGSLALFMLGQPMITTSVLHHLPPEHKPRSAQNPGGWCGEFEGILPYWRSAYSKALDEAGDSLSERLAGENLRQAIEYMGIVRELTDPSPLHRGHPRNRIGHHDRYCVKRYVSTLDRIRHRLSIRSRAS